MVDDKVGDGDSSGGAHGSTFGLKVMLMFIDEDVVGKDKVHGFDGEVNEIG